MRSSLYDSKDSFFHRLDPRTKIIWLLVNFLLSAIWTHPYYLGVGLLSTILTAVFLARQPAKRLLRTIKYSSTLIILSLLIWPLLYKGNIPIFTLPIFGLNKVIFLEGVVFGAAMGLRISWMFVAAFIFLVTTDQRDQVLGLVKMGLPYSIGLAVGIAFRFVPTIVSTLDMIKDAQKSRGLDFDKGNLFERIKRHTPIMMPLFITSVRSATDLALALETRGYGTDLPRSSVRILKYDTVDRVMITTLLASALLFLVLLIFLRIGDFPF